MPPPAFARRPDRHGGPSSAATAMDRVVPVAASIVRLHVAQTMLWPHLLSDSW
jgi:hypothetical protein